LQPRPPNSLSVPHHVNHALPQKIKDDKKRDTREKANTTPSRPKSTTANVDTDGDTQMHNSPYLEPNMSVKAVKSRKKKASIASARPTLRDDAEQFEIETLHLHDY